MPRFKLIACEILYREFCWAVSRSPNCVDVEFLPKGLHDAGHEAIREQLAARIAAVDPGQYERILLGYALCNNAIVGLKAGEIPLVVPRAHDCITLFLGSKERYKEFFFSNPGFYYKTSGWIERGQGLSQSHISPFGPGISGDSISFEKLVERYGEDNARFLYSQLSNMLSNYVGLAYVEMGVGPDDDFAQRVEQEAARLGLCFTRLKGSLSLIAGLVDGPWPEDQFLTVPPGHKIMPSYDDNIVRAVPDGSEKPTHPGDFERSR